MVVKSSVNLSSDSLQASPCCIAHPYLIPVIMITISTTQLKLPTFPATFVALDAVVLTG